MYEEEFYILAGSMWNVYVPIQEQTESKSTFIFTLMHQGTINTPHVKPDILNKVNVIITKAHQTKRIRYVYCPGTKTTKQRKFLTLA